ncbi:MAG TPA: hypothetical protein DDX59_06600 [Lachnospiraceae bacterium]|nr:hypothetical protein [Lachnospiraceae bacterium]
MLVGMIIGISAYIAVGELIGWVETFFESRRPTPTLDELNEINRVIYAADRARLAENLRQVRG